MSTTWQRIRTHSNSSTLSLSKTWSWCIMGGSISDIKSRHFHTEIIDFTYFSEQRAWWWRGVSIYLNEYGTSHNLEMKAHRIWCYIMHGNHSCIAWFANMLSAWMSLAQKFLAYDELCPSPCIWEREEGSKQTIHIFQHLLVQFVFNLHQTT